MVDLFILIIVLFMWCWDYPADHPARRFCQLFSRPFVYIGLWHGWSMFAPEPIHVNRRLRAVLVFDDGIVEEWRPIGPEDSSRLIKTLFARSFKYEYSILGTRVNHLYAPLCEFLERQCECEYPCRKLRCIELLRDFRTVNPCGSDAIYSDPKSVPFYQFDVELQMGRIVQMPQNPGANPLPAQT